MTASIMFEKKKICDYRWYPWIKNKKPYFLHNVKLFRSLWSDVMCVKLMKSVLRSVIISWTVTLAIRNAHKRASVSFSSWPQPFYKRCNFLKGSFPFAQSDRIRGRVVPTQLHQIAWSHRNDRRTVFFFLTLVLELLPRVTFFRYFPIITRQASSFVNRFQGKLN